MGRSHSCLLKCGAMLQTARPGNRQPPVSESFDALSAIAASAELACAELDESARIVHRCLGTHQPHEAVAITASGADEPLSQWVSPAFALPPAMDWLAADAGRSVGRPIVAASGEAADSSVAIHIVLAGRRAALWPGIEDTLRALARLVATRIGRAHAATDTAQMSLARAVAAERERLTEELRHHFAQNLDAILGHLRGAVTDDIAARALSAMTTASYALADLRRRRPAWRQARTIGEAFAATERDVRNIAGETDIRLELALAGPSEHLVANTVLDAASWISRAAVANVVRHTQPARARMTWSVLHDTLVVSVLDDGRGFDPRHAALGDLREMRRRAEIFGGSLVIDSAAGWGTRLRASLAVRPARPLEVDESACALVGTLAGRELDVLRLIAMGHRNRDIASELELSQHTVKFHLTKIFEKLGVRTRAEAATVAFAAGIRPRRASGLAASDA
jgi:signal transduction histidine kinase/DNA-binding CsgD family transcriptional regulator